MGDRSVWDAAADDNPLAADFALIPSFVMPVTNRPLWRNLPSGVRY
jgi:hypothetical protein